ncbi:YceI family protein [Colwellia sp. Arc7-635]|jgi:polyisoprenoid-binding protein YceI|uniref:YceI family protein n=1 Tax=Colwellia sp. Arc7-635 TaxID=2497879 RepID=UPI000F85A3AC|nr:YceI family protein [Colwellia sp. Arc7-635]AZQ86123.1 YceI family protein [Colwellia sp. Arc7-635]
MKKILLASALLTSSAFIPAIAADYVIDTKGAHASINFEASHMGFSVLAGRFNDFSGNFSYDKDNISASKISVTVDTSSFDSNHAKRDKHVRSDDFLDVSKYAQATFVSSKVNDKGEGKLEITGTFTMHGVSKPLVIDAVKVGEGDDPWGGYRAGFSGTATIAMGDFGFKKDFGKVDLILHIEGIRQ